jgi:hypothetical protein
MLQKAILQSRYKVLDPGWSEDELSEQLDRAYRHNVISQEEYDILSEGPADDPPDDEYFCVFLEVMVKIGVLKRLCDV